MYISQIIKKKYVIMKYFNDTYMEVINLFKHAKKNNFVVKYKKLKNNN